MTNLCAKRKRAHRETDWGSKQEAIIYSLLVVGDADQLASIINWKLNAILYQHQRRVTIQ